MKNSDNDTRKLILKKTSTYLRNSIIIFLLTIASLVYGVVFFGNFIQENNKNFLQNDNVHVIQISGKTIDNEYYTLNNTDYMNIKDMEIIKKNSVAEIVFLQFVGAINPSTDEPIMVIGVDPQYSEYICNQQMEDNVYYTNEPIEGGNLGLALPVIKLDEDGNLESDKEITVEYKLKNSIKTVDESAILGMRDTIEHVQEVFVTQDTLLDILKKTGIVESKADDIMEEIVNNNVSMSEIYLYIKDVYHVDECAQALLSQGYYLNYTFKSFDSLSASLRQSSVFFTILIVLLLLTSQINVFLAFHAYLRMQQKDIGILKFYGFSEKRLYNIYKKNINSIFLLCFFILMFYLAILGIVIDIDNKRQIIAIMVAIVTAILLVLRITILKLGLKKIVMKDVMYLLKDAKEFE